jgi:hypothetical protein
MVGGNVIPPGKITTGDLDGVPRPVWHRRNRSYLDILRTACRITVSPQGHIDRHTVELHIHRAKPVPGMPVVFAERPGDISAISQKRHAVPKS